MYDLAHPHGHRAFGYLVDTLEIRALIDETRRLIAAVPDVAARLELKPGVAALLAAEGWLPEPYGAPDPSSGMGTGIGQYALYRAEDGSLTLFSLVIPAGAETPRARPPRLGPDRRLSWPAARDRLPPLDAGEDASRADLDVTREQTMDTGQFYARQPPRDDIHFVRTVSDVPSLSLHLLANDTACVWRQRFRPARATGRRGAERPWGQGRVTAVRLAVEPHHQRRQIGRHDRPHDVEVDVVVAVNQPVSKSDDGRPRDLGAPFSLRDGNTRCRFADDLEQANGSQRQHPVRVVQVAARPVVREGQQLLR